MTNLKFAQYTNFSIHLYLGNRASLRGCSVFKTNSRISCITAVKYGYCTICISQDINQHKGYISKIKKTSPNNMRSMRTLVCDYKLNLHQTTLHHNKIIYTTLHHSSPPYTKEHHHTLNNTTLHYRTLPYTTVHHPTTLHCSMFPIKFCDAISLTTWDCLKGETALTEFIFL